MIPCPDCKNLCGVRDSLLLGEDSLFYVCSRCLHCFDVDEVLAVSEDELEVVSEDDNGFDDAPTGDWNISTPFATDSFLGVPLLRRAEMTSESVQIADVLSRVDRNAVTVPAPPEAAGAPEPQANPFLVKSEPLSLDKLMADIELPPRRPSRPTFTDFSSVDLSDTGGPAPARVSYHAGRGARWAVRAFTGVSAMVGLAAITAFVAMPQSPVHHSTSAVAAAVHPFESHEGERHDETAAASAVAIPAMTPVTITAPTIELSEPPSANEEPAPKPHRVKNTAPQPTLAEAVSKDADAAFRAGNMTRALGLYDQALTGAPAYLPARLGAAAAEWELGRRELARARYRAIVADQPSTAPALAWARAR